MNVYSRGKIDKITAIVEDDYYYFLYYAIHIYWNLIKKYSICLLVLKYN